MAIKKEKREFKRDRDSRDSKDGPRSFRPRMTTRFQIPKGTIFDYKNFQLLQKFLNDRGKIISRRITGVSAKQQRQLTVAVKRARFLALLDSQGVRR